jgi:thiamine biosynthesis protein ThiS
MTVILNGDAREISPGASISDLLDTFELDGDALVVQLNDDIIESDQYGTVRLGENDRIELIQFVGGG